MRNPLDFHKFSSRPCLPERLWQVLLSLMWGHYIQSRLSGKARREISLGPPGSAGKKLALLAENIFQTRIISDNMDRK
jgi:hypothetical protein